MHDAVMIDAAVVERWPDVGAVYDSSGIHYLVSDMEPPRPSRLVARMVGGEWYVGQVLRIRGGELLVDDFEVGMIYASPAEVRVVVGVVSVSGVTYQDPNL